MQFIITGTNHHSEKEFCSYLQYLEYLSQNRPPPNAYELFAKGYEDYLQSPLQVGLECTKRQGGRCLWRVDDPKPYQNSGGNEVFDGPLYHLLPETRKLSFVFPPLIHQPLMDNLESQTYEVFEKDPIKYSQYQQV